MKVLSAVVGCEIGAGGEGPYYRLRVEAGQTVAFSDPVALPWGLLVVCQSGEINVTVAYR